MSDESALEAELPLETVGARLLRAREAAGMSRAQLAAITKIPERHLAAIEASNFAALPARTYAVGFSRSYAKAVGLAENDIVSAVRGEIADQEPDLSRRPMPVFEPGDPARVPAARFAWLAALAALIVVLVGFAFAWRSYYLPSGTLPSILPQETQAPSAPAIQPAPAAAVSGPVVFTALAPAVWVKFYDNTGRQLMQKEMAQGETWTVPGDLPDVRVWTAHPEALGITVGGTAVPRLAETQQTVKDVSVTAVSLLARAVPGAAPGPVALADPRQTPLRPRQAGDRPASGRRTPLPAAPGAAAAIPGAIPSASVPTAVSAATPAPAAT